MFYITVEDKSSLKVVADHRNNPRQFPKHKKARNFIESRGILTTRKTEIVESIEGYTSYFKVDI
jgi:hypothetical protein